MRLLWRIYFTFFTCTLLTFAATAWYGNYALRGFYTEQVAADLLTRANILTSELGSDLQNPMSGPIDRRCKEFGRLTQTRVTVILPDGKVLGDSDNDPAMMDNHKNRSEVTAALSGRTGRSVRFSNTNQRTLMYLAVPALRDGSVVGVVRASLPLAVIDWSLHSLYRQVALGSLIVVAFFAMVAFYLARRMTQPLEDIRRIAERLAHGELRARVALPKGEEMASLARTLNQMAAQLEERMEATTRQSDQQKAVFSSMVEGVVAVNSDGHILELNLSAARLLDLAPDQVRGRSLQESVRNLDLQKFVAGTLTADGPTEAEIVLYGKEERHLQLRGTALTDPWGQRLGALIVLNDITRMKRLETVRRDFVANVSHELKTPITALRGCVETLADPSPRSPEESERFMAMMQRQVDRLAAIIEDLLSLSRIEHDAEHKRVTLEPGTIGDVLRRATQSLATQADAKEITVTVQCPGDLTALINAPLLEQAVGNLIDNAIKYSGRQTRVVVNGAQRGDDIEIQVTDEGPGMERQHISRIFERFYRVDQARSRALGGTGLGLAIVKHIVLAHGGTVLVDSTPGQGSTFTIRIPRQ